MTTIAAECQRVAKLLISQDRKIVFAESCTAGMVSASLGRIPGISRNLCGSLVSYRNETKQAWLKISRSTLCDPGPVSEIVARLMVEAALTITPEANLAASVTGHLGPHAPSEFDGLIFIGVAQRLDDKMQSVTARLQLESRTRVQRQREATRLVLVAVRQALSGTS